jgi:hypothetical protein
MRQVLLVVEVRREAGFPLPLLEGPRLPPWAGEGGSPDKGYLAGIPGKGYAKILTDGVSERVFDSEATAIASDNRILPLASDETTYRFDLGGYVGSVEVRARAVYRKWWKDLQDERGFPDSDFTMVQKSVVLEGRPPEFIRGDADGNGKVNITDAVVILGHLFLGDPPLLTCPDAADADDLGTINITDSIYILGFLFLGSSAPPAPSPLPGPDPTEDRLGC